VPIASRRGFSVGNIGFAKSWNNRIAIAFEFGATTGLNREEKRIWFTFFLL